MAQSWDEHGNPVSAASAAAAAASRSWDESGNPVAKQGTVGDMVTGGIRSAINAVNPFPAMGRTLSRIPADIHSGNYADAVQHAAGGVMPYVGPAASDFIDQIGQPDASTGRMVGDLATVVGVRSGVPLVRGLSRAVGAATDPTFLRELPGGKMVEGAKDAFRNAWNRANATAEPDVPVDINNDPRPMQGPEFQPRVLRDANSPRWAGMPEAQAEGGGPFQSVKSDLPSGRQVGPAPVWRTNPPPEPGLPPRVPQWQRMGIGTQSPETINTEPIYPSGGVLPSGRIAGQPSLIRTGPPITRTPAAPHAAEISPETLTPPAPPQTGIKGPDAESPDYSSVTNQYQPSRSNARFDANGKRLWPGER